MSWDLEIERAGNGFIITTYPETDDSKFRLPSKILFEFKEAKEFCHGTIRESELNALKEVFEYVAEYFNLGYDKWTRNNIDITIDKLGHKVEDENE